MTMRNHDWRPDSRWPIQTAFCGLLDGMVGFWPKNGRESRLRHILEFRFRVFQTSAYCWAPIRVSAIHPRCTLLSRRCVTSRNFLAALERLGESCWLNVLPDVQSRFSSEVQGRLRNTVWLSGCHSWYINRAGRNSTNSPGLTWEYRKLTRRFDTTKYHVGRSVCGELATRSTVSL